ncbi:MAG: hypothetical protein LBG81_06530, partial [Coriobacteriaceae bacterium]|nr:hypothetical protein [Coriobacteriaceae bacterium]
AAHIIDGHAAYRDFEYAAMASALKAEGVRLDGLPGSPSEADGRDRARMAALYASCFRGGYCARPEPPFRCVRATDTLG